MIFLVNIIFFSLIRKLCLFLNFFLIQVSLPDSVIETSRPVKLKDFAEHYRIMSADSDFRLEFKSDLLLALFFYQSNYMKTILYCCFFALEWIIIQKTIDKMNYSRFSEEYEEFKHVGRDQPCTAADLPVNRPKNR